MNLVAPTYYRCDSGVAKIVEPYLYPFAIVCDSKVIRSVPYTELKRTTKEEWDKCIGSIHLTVGL